jgi:beta-lactamase superfamily II metal-dependent hydrolase
LSELTFLDVGHGNATVLITDDRTVVIDAPAGPTLRDFLHARGRMHVDAAVISHADRDHCAGLGALLVSRHGHSVGSLHINAEPMRRSVTYRGLVSAVKYARMTKSLSVNSITAASEPPEAGGGASIAVLGPAPEDVLSPPRGDSADANSLSAVLRVDYEGEPQALIPGDLDAFGLKRLLEEDPGSLRARALVFPHHGAGAGQGDARAFARDLTAAVQPDVVVFSFSRERGNYPHPQIVAGVRSAAPEAYIACTGLSVNCAGAAPEVEAPHLHAIGWARTRRGCSCAGTVTIDLTTRSVVAPVFEGHQAFITQHVATPMCRAHADALAVLPTDVVNAADRR